MAENLTPKQAENDLTKYTKFVKSKTNDFETLMATNAAGLIKPRIHNDGRAADGKLLSKYSKGHAKKRQKTGRQVSQKDFELTDQLIKSQQVFKFRNGVIFGILPGRRKDKGVKRNITNRQLVRMLEDQEGKEIFVPSKDELKKLDKVAAKYFDDLFDEFFS